MDRSALMGEPLTVSSDNATGGIMTLLGTRAIPNRTNCAHSKTVAIISAGIERIVCESCRNVSFMFLDDMTDEIDRDIFARTVDQEKLEASS
ncbi:MAG: hypothetical protein V3S32_10230 [Acidimicrobiia bacterium]